MTITRDGILELARLLPLYGTPAYVARLPDAVADRINPELRRLILAKADEETGGLDNSNLGGWHSGRDLLQWGGESVHTVVQAAGEVATSLTVDRTGRRVNAEWQVNCWANVNRRGHANRRHTHPACFWSGTYYVDDGNDGGADEPGGRFEFHDPRGVAAAIALAPEPDALIRPKTGTMVLFPSWMPHSVQPYQGDGTRISIAFNFSFARRPK